MGTRQAAPLRWSNGSQNSTTVMAPLSAPAHHTPTAVQACDRRSPNARNRATGCGNVPPLYPRTPRRGNPKRPGFRLSCERSGNRGRADPQVRAGYHDASSNPDPYMINRVWASGRTMRSRSGGAGKSGSSEVSSEFVAFVEPDESSSLPDGSHPGRRSGVQAPSAPSQHTVSGFRFIEEDDGRPTLKEVPFPSRRLLRLYRHPVRHSPRVLGLPGRHLFAHVPTPHRTQLRVTAVGTDQRATWELVENTASRIRGRLVLLAASEDARPS